MAAIHAVARSRPLGAALLLAASAGAKPWALAFAPLLLVLPRVRWRRAAAVWLAVVVAAWLPFVLADLRTLHASGFSIPNVASSSLRALGVTVASTPAWDRPLQLLLGVILGAIAVRRGRWLVVPAVVLAARMVLDPGAYPYYTAGLVLATTLLDLGWRRTRWPWVSMWAVLGLYVVRYLGPLTPTNAQLGWLRAATLLIILAVALGPELRLRASRASGHRDGTPSRANRPGHHPRGSIRRFTGGRRHGAVSHPVLQRTYPSSVRYLLPCGGMASLIKSA